MRALRFVGPGDDGEHVIVETTDGGEQFSLEVDAALRDAIRFEPPVAAGDHSAPASAIGPREIQVRVRAGESPQVLAEHTGMTIERVLRFAGPVLDERSRIADEARRARAQRSTTEGQIVIFGEAVDERFAAHGIDPTTVTWDARRRDDGQWIVSAHWLGGEVQRTAEWMFNLSARHVTPTDDTSADLLSDRPIRPFGRPRTTESGRPALTVAPPLVPGVVAFPVMPDANTGPLPSRDDVFDQEAAERAASASAGPDEADYDAPQLPLTGLPAVEAEPEARPRRAHVTNLGVAHRDEETDEERAARARIPSWDDILLGVRRKGEHPSR